MKTSRKILLSVAAVGSAARIAGLGTYATFTDSETATQQIDTGTVTITIGAAGPDNRLNVGASGMVPGDTLQRRVKLTNPTGAGQQNLASMTLATVATTSSVLDTDAADGLHMKIEKCSLAWVESASTPYTYTCAGTPSTVLARTSIITNPSTPAILSGMSSLTVGNTDDLVVTVDLPSTAGNGFQGKSSIVQYTFTGTQRAATDK